MNRVSNVDLALAALLLEAAIGYPAFVYRAIGHPVAWMGALLSGLEMRFNRPAAQDIHRRMLGILTLFVLLAATAGAAFILDRIFSRGPVGAGLLILAASSLLAQRGLHDHVRAVADALQRDGLEAGRKAVSMIVGRNPDCLDAAGVARAAIESLAENFSDGIVAPAFWLAVGGLPGAACYKATNTADSMIGHRTPRYAAFGWAAARLDDLINLPASRLSAFLLVLASIAVGGPPQDAVAGSPQDAVRAVLRDAHRHRSPNAGWPEAAMAGALGLQLAGPRVYGDTLLDDAFMGNGRREATVADIIRALRLYQAACVAQWLVLFAIVVIWRH
ncbi:adenosylcobinamide-phosphate synthase CbiB [Rhodopila sp.]|uniref:adenosylcobinamide-phosphate synthase CbiB n=1 Tax=Rhodopila sp. TaxID=2480087 RepID=UPI003D0F67F7